MLPGLLASAAVVLLVVLDVRGRLRLDHPAWVAAAGVLFPVSFCWSGLCLLVRLLGSVSLPGGVLIVPVGLLSVYVLGASHVRPFLKSGEKTGRRLLTGGMILGLLLQGTLGGLYIAAAVMLQDMMDGPFWAAPFYPLALVVLWPAMHLVFHVALAAIAIDPLLLLAGACIGIMWAVQVSFLLHGEVRALLWMKKRVWKWIAYLLLSFVPVLNLICAGRLLWQLMRRTTTVREEAAA